MPHHSPPAAATRRLLEHLRAAAGAEVTSSGILHLLEKLVGLLGSDHAVAGWRTEDGSHQLWWWPQTIDFAHRNAAYENRVHEHPVRNAFLNTRSNDPIQLSDLLTLSAWKSTGLYDEYFRHYGVTRMLAVYAPVGRAEHLSLGLARSGTDFGEAERTLLQLAQPTLVALARRLAQERKSRSDLIGDSGLAEHGPPAARHALLTRREVEVWRWIAEGKTNGEVAVILGCAPGTVKNHVERILGKLGVETRTGAARLWFEAQITARNRRDPLPPPPR